MIYLGADHQGFALKEKIKKWLDDWDFKYQDLGASKFDPKDDFPDYGFMVAKEVIKRKDSWGILICGSGAGMDIVANKVKGIRSLLAISAKQVYQAKKDNHTNILCLAANFVSLKETKKIIRFFLETEFAQENKYLRRVEKISQVEKIN
ncbi:MAG TPA: RpiB/LacA/LacB family sugar-phosphate isomerase [Candidatus Bathyarchaeia archaeon]|nr:RpiB/LacA/LacB family sugar-phosphate isomerase [Candidatus Bathyarchaeia archaeon]